MSDDYTPNWEDRGFWHWYRRRQGSGPALITIVIVLGLRQLSPGLLAGTDLAHRTGQVAAFIVVFLVVHLMVGYAWYRATRRGPRRRPVGGP